MAIGKQGRAIHRQGIKIRGQLIIYRPSSLPERDEDLGGRKGGRDRRGKGEGDPTRFSDPRGLDSIPWLPVGNTAPRQDWASAPESQDALRLHTRSCPRPGRQSRPSPIPLCSFLLCASAPTHAGCSPQQPPPRPWHREGLWEGGKGAASWSQTHVDLNLQLGSEQPRAS